MHGKVSSCVSRCVEHRMHSVTNLNCPRQRYLEHNEAMAGGKTLHDELTDLCHPANPESPRQAARAMLGHRLSWVADHDLQSNLQAYTCLATRSSWLIGRSERLPGRQQVQRTACCKLPATSDPRPPNAALLPLILINADRHLLLFSYTLNSMPNVP